MHALVYVPGMYDEVGASAHGVLRHPCHLLEACLALHVLLASCRRQKMKHSAQPATHDITQMDSAASEGMPYMELAT